MNTLLKEKTLLDLADIWLALQQHVQLKRIETEDEFVRMCAMADRLADEVVGEENHPLYSLFMLVVELIGLWEAEHVDEPDVEPRDLLLFMMEEHSLTAQDLSDIAPEKLVEDILAGRETISPQLAGRLATRFHLNPDTFL